MDLIGASQAPAPQAYDADLISDGTDQGFQAQVLQASMTTPVIVDFWAPWCGPCKQLGPVLEAAVRKAKGAVKLVKINIDENPAYAGQLRVKSIPAVIAFDKGRPADGFMGALPGSEVEKFIQRLIGGGPDPAEIEALLVRAQQSLDAGDPGGAAQDFATLLQIAPDNMAAVAGLARCYLAGGDPERARELIAMAPEDKANDPAIQGVKAALDLVGNAKGGGETEALAARVNADPKNHALRFELAQALAARSDFEGAIEHLLAIMTAKRDWNDGAAKAELLKLFDAAGPKSQATRDGRRRLSALLFS
jgi:putative thioredoxin